MISEVGGIWCYPLSSRCSNQGLGVPLLASVSVSLSTLLGKGLNANILSLLRMPLKLAVELWLEGAGDDGHETLDASRIKCK